MEAFLISLSAVAIAEIGDKTQLLTLVLATRFGTHAADLVAEGRTGVMVALRGGALTEIPFGEVAHRVRTVTADDPLLHAAVSVGTSFGVPALAPELARMR